MLALKQGLFDDSYQVLLFSKMAQGHTFIYEIMNEKEQNIPTTTDDINLSEEHSAVHLCVSEIFDRIFLISTLTEDPSQFKFQIRNERTFTVEIFLDFIGSINLVRNDGGPLTNRFKAMGNGRITDGAVLVKIDSDMEHEIVLAVRIRSSGDLERKVDYYAADEQEEEERNNKSKLLIGSLQDNPDLLAAKNGGYSIDEVDQEPDFIDKSYELQVPSL